LCIASASCLRLFEHCERRADSRAPVSEETPFRYLDAGALINARTVERMTMITGALGRRLGSYPRMNWRLLG
jgi:hypothetical protein